MYCGTLKSRKSQVKILFKKVKLVNTKTGESRDGISRNIVYIGMVPNTSYIKMYLTYLEYGYIITDNIHGYQHTWHICRGRYKRQGNRQITQHR